MKDGAKPLATVLNVEISGHSTNQQYAKNAGMTLRFWGSVGKKMKTEVESIISGWEH
jgi:hypothetical protein